MNFERIPVLYKPTTIISVDDDLEFTENLKLFLPDEILLRTFENPIEALNFINTCYPTSFLNTNFTLETSFLETIYKEIYNFSRYEDISVVISDFSMPQLNGLEFLKKIHQEDLQKILLTGDASDQLAISAFNKNLIHRFVKKNAKGIYEDLLSAIGELRKTYFQQFTDKNIDKNLKEILSNTKFIKIFNEQFDQNQIVEFYILDTFGSYVMFDAHMKPTFLIIRTKNSIAEEYDFASNFETSEDILTQLKNFKAFPFLFFTENKDVTPEEWGKYLCKADALDENNDIFYSVIYGEEITRFGKEKILTFDEYLYA